MKLQWKEGKVTTIVSIIGVILFGLVVFGVITASEKDQLMEAIKAVVDAIPGGDWTVIASAATALVGVVLGLFVKDPLFKKK